MRAIPTLPERAASIQRAVRSVCGRSALALAVSGSVAAPAAAQEVLPERPDQSPLPGVGSVPVETIIEQPERLQRQLVTTTGELDECLAPGAFTIESGAESRGFADNDLLVVRPEPRTLAQPLRPFGPVATALLARAQPRAELLGECRGFLGSTLPPTGETFADDAPVRVTGLVGEFAAESVERAFGVDLAEESFAPFEEQPVFVALNVAPLARFGAAPAAPAAQQPAAPVAAPVSPVAEEARGQLVDEGIASTYGAGDGFQGNITACGQVFDTELPSVAHKTLPCGTMLRIVDTATGRSVIAEVQDRGPFTPGRVVDLSMAAYRQIDPSGQPGLREVRVYVLPPSA